MATRKNRRGQYKKATTRRSRKKQPLKISSIAQQYIIANAITRGVAGTNLVPFLTEGWLTDKTAGSSMGSGNSWTFSAQEMIQGMVTGDFGMSPQWDNLGVKAAFEKNLKENGWMMVATVIGTPILFKFGKKLLNKPIILPANRLLRSAGIREVKV